MRINKDIIETLENATNEELVALTKTLLTELQNRPYLCDYLTEMTYNKHKDAYNIIYNEETFQNHLKAFHKYLFSNIYEIAKNKKEIL